MSNNKNLNKAKKTKNDEYYTQYKDVKKELDNYSSYFENKVVYCNFDTIHSSFWKYFHLNFSKLKLKKLIATSLDSYEYTYSGGDDENVKIYNNYYITSGGFYNNKGNLRILESSDIIVTNPPFSLFREVVDTLISYNKEFIMIGNLNAIKYKNIFKYFMENKIWTGINGVHEFMTPQGTIKKFGNILWYTNIDIEKRHIPLKLTRYYDCVYKKYDTYDAIDIPRTKDIPKDYSGIMGVPISFITNYCSDQFEIVGCFNHGTDSNFDLAKPIVNGKELYPRIAIKFR